MYPSFCFKQTPVPNSTTGPHLLHETVIIADY